MPSGGPLLDLPAERAEVVGEARRAAPGRRRPRAGPDHPALGGLVEVRDHLALAGSPGPVAGHLVQHPHRHDPAGPGPAPGARTRRTSTSAGRRPALARPPPARSRRAAGSSTSRRCRCPAGRRRPRAGTPGSGRAGRSSPKRPEVTASQDVARRRAAPSATPGRGPRRARRCRRRRRGPSGRRASRALAATSSVWVRPEAEHLRRGGRPSVVHRATRASSTSARCGSSAGKRQRGEIERAGRAAGSVFPSDGGSRIEHRRHPMLAAADQMRGVSGCAETSREGPHADGDHAARRASPPSSRSWSVHPEFPAERRAGGRRRRRSPAAAGARPHRHPVRDHRPARRRWTSTRRCTSSATATGTSCTTRSPTSRPSSRRATRSTWRPTAVARRCTAPTPRSRCTRTVLSRGRGIAAARPGSGRRCSGRSRSTPTGEGTDVAGRAGAGAQPGEARLRRRAAAVDAGTADEMFGAARRGRRAAQAAGGRARRRVAAAARAGDRRRRRRRGR